MPRYLSILLTLQIFLISSIAAAQAEEVSSVSSRIIYGSDSREWDIENYPEEIFSELARRSVVAMIPKDLMCRGGQAPCEDKAESRYYLRNTVQTLGQKHDLCETERFRNFPTAAFCSAVLIDHDVVVTAAHCMVQDESEDIDDCRDTYFAFDYYVNSDPDLEPMQTQDVFECEKVIARKRTNPGVTPVRDYAVIKLNRSVNNDREPAPIRPTASAMNINERLRMIGFGSGLPAMIDDGGRVFENRFEEGNNQRDYFVANLDAFSSSSGSPVFDKVGRLSGVLFAGQSPDYVDSGNFFPTCNEVYEISNSFDPEQGAELVQYIHHPLKALCNKEPERGVCDVLGRSLNPEDPVNFGNDDQAATGACSLAPASKHSDASALFSLFVLGLALSRRFKAV